MRIGLINNMPDSAVVRTEQQFAELLRSSADGVRVEVVLYSLPAIVRRGAVRDRIQAGYEPIDSLWTSALDAIVVTGAEPRERDLRHEVFWDALAGLIDWIDDRRIPAMFSCLAAHAAVLHADGVPRASLADKCFGVFEEDVAVGHELMEGMSPRMWLPHSRWNQVGETELRNAGYQILTRSDEAGVGYFARERNGLWLLCQGHPEYDAANLLREYRRDVLRFLRQERSAYPDLPRSYLGDDQTHLLDHFRQTALAHGDPAIMKAFPWISDDPPFWEAWRSSASGVFGNWLRHAAAAKVSHDTATSGYRWGPWDPDGQEDADDQYLPEGTGEPAASSSREAWQPS